MGLFGNNDRQLRIELAKELAHSCNDANKEILEVMEGFEENKDNFQHISEELIDIVEKILPKLEPEEVNSLTAITEKVVALQAEYVKRYTMTIELSNKQSERTKNAIEKYERIVGN